MENFGPDLVLNLGDSLYGPLEPEKTAERIIESDFLSIAGNEDVILVEEDPELEKHQSLMYTMSQLTTRSKDWVKKLNKTESIKGKLLLCHGTPNSENEYLIEEVTRGEVKLKDRGSIMKNLAGREEVIVLCGHSHIPRTMVLRNTVTIINPGSVGLQAYSDDQPFKHCMQAGTPHARYALLTVDGDQVTVENRVVNYNWQLASEVAKKNGREDWSLWLRTGISSNRS